MIAGRTWLVVGALLAASALIAVPVTTDRAGADAIVPSITGAATGVAGAIRGTQVQLTPPLQPPRCRRVGVVGDSLTAASRSWLVRDLDAAGYEAYVDGEVNRRIPASVREPYSGVLATRRIRSTWGEADCWVIGLGSNDLESGAGDAALAARWIGEQLDAVTPGARVWWVNVHYRLEPGNPFDFLSATSAFNGALEAIAAADPLLAVIDWYSLLGANPGWLVDGVHVRTDGYIARTGLTMDALAG